MLCIFPVGKKSPKSDADVIICRTAMNIFKDKNNVTDEV